MPGEYELLRQVLSDRPIAFHPMLARLFGGINEALLFQQIAYWSGKGADPVWIYKTQADLEEETTLSRYQQEQSRARLKKLGVLEETKRGLPAKLYYRIDWPTVFVLLESVAIKSARNSQPRMRETDIQDREEVTSLSERNSHPLKDAKTTTKTNVRDIEDSKIRESQNDVDKYDEARLLLLPYAQDLAREMNDQAPLTSTVSRLVNLYKGSGLDLDTFTKRLMQARAVTQERTAAIRATGDDPARPLGRKTKMAYCLAVLEDRLGPSQADPQPGAASDISPQQPPAPRRRRTG